MNKFTYRMPMTVYFDEPVKETLTKELKDVGDHILFAYGGGSIKKNGIYNVMTGILRGLGKTITEFSGIMPNPTYAKVQEGAKL